MAGAPNTWHQQAAAAALAAAHHVRIDGGSPGAASHRTAGTLFGFRSVDTEIDVSIAYPRKLSIPGVKTVRSRDLVASDITWVDGIPTTTPERTIVDFGLIFPDHEVLRVLRHCISTGLLIRRDVIRMRLRTSKQGRTGTGVLGRCLQALSPLAEETESGIEAFFLETCERHEIPLPATQHPVKVNGRIYRLDFAYPVERIFVEIDGFHHDKPLRIAKDGGRQNDLVAHGWAPIRLHHDQLKYEPGRAAALLRQLLDSRTLAA